MNTPEWKRLREFESTLNEVESSLIENDPYLAKLSSMFEPNNLVVRLPEMAPKAPNVVFEAIVNRRYLLRLDGFCLLDPIPRKVKRPVVSLREIEFVDGKGSRRMGGALFEDLVGGELEKLLESEFDFSSCGYRLKTEDPVQNIGKVVNRE